MSCGHCHVCQVCGGMPEDAEQEVEALSADIDILESESLVLQDRIATLEAQLAEAQATGAKSIFFHAAYVTAFGALNPKALEAMQAEVARLTAAGVDAGRFFELCMRAAKKVQHLDGVQLRLSPAHPAVESDSREP